MNSPASEALKNPCPLCGAEPGQPCRTCTGSGERNQPHISRRKADQPKFPPREALCCECGELRTVGAKFSIRYGDANRSQGTFDDTRGWTSTCTLRCAQCRTATRHALVARPDEPDWIEDTQRFILGGEAPSKYWSDNDRKRLRARYFEQFPRNPKLTHRYYISEAKDAFAAGEKTITSLCGAPMDLDFDPNISGKSGTNNELIQPDRIDWETEFEDHDTGMWWVDMQCVDCLAVANTIRIKYQRQEVLTKLLEASAIVEHLDAADLAALSEHLDSLIGGE